MVAASLFLIAFEMLRNSIINQIRIFFTNEYINGEPRVSDEYYSALGLKKKNDRTLKPSLKWLLDNEVISQGDIKKFHKVREYRNGFAHNNFFVFIRTGVDDLYTENFLDMKTLIEKINTWWFRNVEMAINEEFQDINPEELTIPPILLEIMIQIVFGDKDTAKEYLINFKKVRQENKK